jgi:hypothetical protein
LTTAGFAVGVAVGLLGVVAPTVLDRGLVSRSRSASVILAVISFGGAYACVPDTERALVALGVAVAIAVAGTLLGTVPPARVVGVVTLAGLVWIAVTDGASRPSAAVGAVASIGVLSLVMVRPSAPLRSRVVIAHVALVAVASRRAGLQPSMHAALLDVLLSWTLLVAVWALIDRAKTRTSRSPTTGSPSFDDH